MSMRLQANEINAIKECFKDVFLATDHIWIFGSRVNNEKKVET